MLAEVGEEDVAECAHGATVALNKHLNPSRLEDDLYLSNVQEEGLFLREVDSRQGLLFLNPSPELPGQNIKSLNITNILVESVFSVHGQLD